MCKTGNWNEQNEQLKWTKRVIKMRKTVMYTIVIKMYKTR